MSLVSIMDDDETRKDAIRAGLRKAIKAEKSQAALAKKIGKTQGHISKWLQRGHVPAEMVPLIEDATGVPCHVLRPDIFRLKHQVAAE